MEAGDSELFGQPRGLFVIAGTEVWDRISFQGMQALLVLYMVHQLLLPGHIEHVVGFQTYRGLVEHLTGPLSVKALATQTFGVYVSLAYLMPLIGGAAGDALLGRRNAVVLGGLLMTAGHFSLAFDESFLIAILLLVVGAGLFRGNLQPQAGELYEPHDRRRAVAFQVYGWAINAGAFLAPLITGLLSKYYGWHVGFGFAGFGMLVGLVFYLAGSSALPKPRTRTAKVGQKFGRAEWRAILFLLALMPVSALFWAAQSQIWNTYNLWVGDHVDMRVFGWEMPIPWLQSLDAAPLVLIPFVLLFWSWQAQRGREPDEFVKAALGCFIFALSMWWLGFATIAYTHGRAPLAWVALFHLTSNLGWVYFAPTLVALYSRVAPPSVNATMIGVNALSISLGSLVSGRLGGLYEQVTPFMFWTIHAALVALAGVLLLLFRIGAKDKPKSVIPAPAGT